MARENVLFNQQMVTVILEHVRLFERVLYVSSGLTLTQYCLLRAIKQSDEGMRLEQVEKTTVLKRRSILASLTALENSGLIVKSNHAQDSRKMIISITSRAKPLINEVNKQVYKALKKTFWNSISNKELVMINLEGMLNYNLQYIPNERDESNAPKDVSTELALSFFVGNQTMVTRWENLARSQGAISFSAYRLLALLENLDYLTPSEAAASLLIAQSRVTSAKKELLLQQLIHETSNPDDKRGKYLQCTRKGLRAVRVLNRKMERLTDEMYGLIDDESKKRLNAWHSRMYLEVEEAHLIIDTL